MQFPYPALTFHPQGVNCWPETLFSLLSFLLTWQQYLRIYTKAIAMSFPVTVIGPLLSCPAKNISHLFFLALLESYLT